jgi:hypothetical protein
MAAPLRTQVRPETPAGEEPLDQLRISYCSLVGLKDATPRGRSSQALSSAMRHRQVKRLWLCWIPCKQRVLAAEWKLIKRPLQRTGSTIKKQLRKIEKVLGFYTFKA